MEQLNNYIPDAIITFKTKEKAAKWGFDSKYSWMESKKLPS